MKINRVGKLGDIYTDPGSGKTYKCTYTYKDSNGHIDCDWKEISAVPVAEIEESKIEVKTNNNPSDEIQTKYEIESEKISEGKNSEKQMDSNKPVNHNHHRTKYTNYSKK